MKRHEIDLLTSALDGLLGSITKVEVDDNDSDDLVNDLDSLYRTVLDAKEKSVKLARKVKR